MTIGNISCPNACDQSEYVFLYFCMFQNIERSISIYSTPIIKMLQNTIKLLTFCENFK